MKIAWFLRDVMLTYVIQSVCRIIGRERCGYM